MVNIFSLRIQVSSTTNCLKYFLLIFFTEPFIFFLQVYRSPLHILYPNSFLVYALKIFFPMLHLIFSGLCVCVSCFFNKVYFVALKVIKPFHYVFSFLCLVFRNHSLWWSHKIFSYMYIFSVFKFCFLHSALWSI